MRVRLAVLFLALALNAGGASAQAEAAASQRSGFLGDYSQLQPAKGREGMLTFIRKGDYKGYTKVMIDPIEVWQNPAADYKGMPAAAMVRLADGISGSFKRALEPQYQVVTSPGPDVLRVRIALTGITPVKPDVKATDFIPIKAVFTAVSGGKPNVVELSAEMEVLDASNTRVAAAVANRKGDKALDQGEQVTWKHLEAISDYWAKAFRQRLDELRGSTPN
jgi:hypothetical protein